MPQTLDSFAAQLHDILSAENSAAGREKAASLVREVLKDTTFVNSLFDENSPERKVVYEDPQLGFCLLAHRYKGAKDGPPHDHGPSWAIYGQAEGETVMSDWAPVDTPQPGQPTKIRKVKEYTLRPGDAHVYNEGDVHAPSRSGPTRLIRIEGMNMEGVKRGRYEAVQE